MHGTPRPLVTPRRRRLAGAVCALGVLTALGACSDATGSGANPTGSTEASGEVQQASITVGVIPIVDVAPIYLGVDQGFFEEEGLSLTLEKAQGGAAIVPAVIAGQYQFGFSNSTSLILASSNGVAVHAVTSGVATTGKDGADFGAVIVPSDSDIQSAKDLEGKTVAVNTLNNINTTTINQAVRDAGGDPTTITYTELAFPDIVGAVEKGDVDAGQVVEPFLTTATGKGMRQVVSNYAATDPNLTISMYFVADTYASENPDVVDRFTTATNKSLEYADANPDEVRRILATYTDIDESVLATITLPKWPTAIDADSVELLADLAVQDGFLPSKPDLSKLLP